MELIPNSLVVWYVCLFFSHVHSYYGDDPRWLIFFVGAINQSRYGCVWKCGISTTGSFYIFYGKMGSMPVIWREDAQGSPAKRQCLQFWRSVLALGHAWCHLTFSALMSSMWGLRLLSVFFSWITADTWRSRFVMNCSSHLAVVWIIRGLHSVKVSTDSKKALQERKRLVFGISDGRTSKLARPGLAFEPSCRRSGGACTAEGAHKTPGLQDGGYCGWKQVLAVCITSKSLGDFAGFMQYGATLLFQKPCKAETVELAAIVV